jgi:predicted MFS family arabinose efflux permease
MGEAQLGSWRRASVVGAVMLSAFSFNTTENLPIGLLKLMAADLDVSLSSVGYLVSGYGLTVAVVSLPLAHLTRHTPRRYLLGLVLGVLFLSSWLPTVAPSYGFLLVARIATALAQALFWAVMGPVAVGMFSPAVRGRVIGLLSVGGSLATVLGVPAGNWLGRHTGWEVPFLVVSGCALAALAVIGLLLPTSRPEDGHAAYGAEPSRRGFFVVLAVTGLSVTGVFVGFTYIVDFLQDTSGFSGGMVSTLLGVFGLGGFLGVTMVGPLLDRFPRGTLVVPVAVQATALLALYAGGSNRVVTGLAIALLGAAAGPIFMATQSRVMRVAPGRTEIALAANGAAFNVGVALGALCGGLSLRVFDVRTTFLMGGLLTVAGLVVLFADSPPAARGTPVREESTGRAADVLP